MLETYFDKYYHFSHAKTKRNRKCKPKKLFFKGYDHSMCSNMKKNGLIKRNQLIKNNQWMKKSWLVKKESVDLSNIPPLEADKEGKEEKGIKILTPNKLFTRFPVILAQIKAGTIYAN